GFYLAESACLFRHRNPDRIYFNPIQSGERMVYARRSPCFLVFLFLFGIWRKNIDAVVSTSKSMENSGCYNCLYHVGRRSVINPQYLIQATEVDRSVKSCLSVSF